MSSADSEDPSFVALPARLRRRIDDAFDSIVLRPGAEVSPGGFIIEESESQPAHEAGGFIVPSNHISCIPLSEIPHALKLLNLIPDDDVMGVFKSAATGWGAQNVGGDGVSRKDWRAICAALLEGEYGNGSDPESLVADPGEMGADSGLESDEYHTEEPSGDTEEDSSDAYEEPARTAKPANAHSVGQKPLAKNKSAAERSRQLSESEKAQCRQDFGRFFPHVSDDELDRQRVTVKDIARVANMLKESLKTDEILEMLEAVSTSPDKSVNLADFERMMMLTKLI